MKNKSFLSRLFAHDSVLMLISFILAFTAWFIINSNSDSENKITVTDIPISIDLQDDSLEVFKMSSETASVEISGNRILIGSITAADIQVTGSQDQAIDTAGEYELTLSAKKSGVKTNYTIDTSTLDPQKITVFVDKSKEAEFEIDNQMVYKVDDNHYASVVLSDTSVTLSGPDSVISKIDSVAVMGTIDGEESTKPVSIKRNLIYLDSAGNELSGNYIESNVDSVTVTLTVYPTKEVKLALNKVNVPENAPSIKLTPSSIRVAGPQETLDSLEDDTFVVGTFDYADYTNENVNIYIDISLPTGLKNLSSDTSVNAQTNLSGYHMKVLSCKINSSLSSSKYKTDFNYDEIDVNVFGPETTIDQISESDISVIADFSGNMNEINNAKTLSLNVPLVVKISDEYADCWAHGSYSADVTVSKK